MSKRNIEKHILMNKAEAQDLQKKAKRACLSEGGLIRLLLKGYEPREKPDERFYDVMRELSAIGNNINQLAVKANSLGFVDAPQLKKEAERWHKFQADVERTFLRPDKSRGKAVTVRSGDTLSHIARRNHTTVAKLRKLLRNRRADSARRARAPGQGEKNPHGLFEKFSEIAAQPRAHEKSGEHAERIERRHGARSADKKSFFYSFRADRRHGDNERSCR